MAYGLRISNSSGDVVIDGTYRNHAVAESGTASVGVYGAWSDARAATVTLATPIAMSRGPLVWGRTGVDRVSCGLLGLIIDGSDRLAGFHLGAFPDSDYPLSNPAVSGAYPINVDWRVTALPAGPSAATHGFRVYDPAGALVYDSGLEYLRIHHVSAAIDVPWFPRAIVSYAALANPWYCLSALAWLGSSSPSSDDTEWNAAMVRRRDSASAEVWVAGYAYQAGDTLYAFQGQTPKTRQLVVAQ